MTVTALFDAVICAVSFWLMILMERRNDLYCINADIPAVWQLIISLFSE